MAELKIDASDMELLSAAFQRMPQDMQAKVMGRAMRRMRDMSRTRVGRKNAEHTQMPYGMIRDRLVAYFKSGGNTIELIEKSGWIPLYKLGASQTTKGVSVKLRGSYRHAFIAAVMAGKRGASHTGVFHRVPGQAMTNNRSRQAIRELFGANPAHAIVKNPQVYLEVLAALIENYLAPRVLHEMDRLLPRL
ncbi:hypothetical protein ATN81_14005 [Agrobacterium pusense]|uniref:hypothetical protein n=1 Tax=Agrobacterium pusense TaxID=648995 RepID=UPI0009298ADC|nr:hypothetical protein [Agrobacterium pusense]OJH54281.1 hypothetical protein ATN81_14005 [Agrobacterium pusense]OJH58801.1 hypothetical protein BA725_15695 [Agrobacterium pusense]